MTKKPKYFFIFSFSFSLIFYLNSAIAQTEYCAQRIYGDPKNACFGTLWEAERFVRTEPLPERGNQFLEPIEVTPSQPGNFSVKYRVPYSAPEDYVGAFHRWHNRCLHPVPIRYASNYGCETEGQLANEILSGWPYSGGNYTGWFIGEYGPMPPEEWYTVRYDELTQRGYVLVSMNSHMPIEARRNFHVTNGVNSEDLAVRRTDYWECPRLFSGLAHDGHGDPPSPWPLVCWNNAQGSVRTQSNQYDSCSKEGNPCVAGTGNKEFRDHDFEWEGVTFTRAYNSIRDLPLLSGFGDNWAHVFSDRLLLVSNTTTDKYWIRNDGYYEVFAEVTDSQYRSRHNTGSILFRESDTVALTHGRWRIQASLGNLRWFDENGRLKTAEIGGRRFNFEYCDRVALGESACHSPDTLKAVVSSTGRMLEFEYSMLPINNSPNGLELHEAYRVTRITGDGETLIEYGYDENLARLIHAIYPNNANELKKEYLYAEPDKLCMDGFGTPLTRCHIENFPHHLTGVIDESQTRYATYTYDNHGRVTSSAHIDDANSVSLIYQPDGSANVLFSSGMQRTYQFSAGPFRQPSNTLTISTDGYGNNTTLASYVSGRVVSRTDARGHRTNYEYDSFGETVRREALTATGVATPYSRRTEVDYDSTWLKASERRLLNATNILVSRENWTYNNRGHVLTHTETDSAINTTRTFVFSYCEQFDVDTPGTTCPILGYQKSIDGPRTDASDVTTFQYYPATDESGCDTSGPCHRKGDLWRITNALGQVTEHLRYDRAGRVTRSKDANGVLTDLAYHPRGWLTQRIVRARADGVPDASDAVTTFDYEPTGLISRIIQPDGDYADYSYDGAHRLVGIADSLGNYVVYTLDPAGNRTAEETFDPDDALRRRLAREYNTLGRLVKERDAIVDGSNPNGRLVAEHGYDNNGNRTHTVDGLGRRTDHEYDPLNRLAKTLDALNPRGIVEYAYDARDNLIEVTDPKGLTTEYLYDGLNNLRELRSPDTGTTVYAYDSAGNRIQQTDARGVIANYTYDALNRLTSIGYPSDAGLNVTFVYDQVEANCGSDEEFSIGRLSRVIDGSGTTKLCYDTRGNLVQKQIDDGFGNLLTTRYRYTQADRLTGLTYPSGRELELAYDAAGRPASLSYRQNASSSWSALLSSASYYPFGPLAGFTFGNGRTVTKGYDTNYAIESLGSSVPDGINLDIGVDVLGNIVDITPTSAGAEQARSYVYDPLYRLSEVRDANNALIEAFNYDATGNRMSKQTGVGTQTYSYPLDSHRLDAVDSVDRDYDAAGNLTDILSGTAHPAFEYGAHNRHDRFLFDSTEMARYAYNGQGERACKWLDTDAIRYVYDSGGQLLGEYDAAGNALAEYVYLDSLPVAVFNATGLAYIETDHLGTPRVIVDAGTNLVIWHWPLTGSAFGEHAPDEDADGDTLPYVFNLRFPGQYYDSESGLHYNYFRDYEPGTGRYTQSDPIGLQGGPSTYAYTTGNPVKHIDPFGLFQMCHRDVLLPFVPGRHCYVRFQDGSTASYDPGGVRPDPDPGQEGTLCTEPQEPELDKCVSRAMQNCVGSEYSFTKFNCCHCVEQALKECRTSIPITAWPNWPINPGPQPGEPGYRPDPIYGPNLGQGRQ